MPTWFRNPGTGIGRGGKAVLGHSGGPFDDESAGGVIEGEEVELRARRGIKDVGKRHLKRSGKGGGAGGLNRDVERVLQDARRQHVADEFRWDGADADLTRCERLAIGTNQALWLDFDGELLALLRCEIWRGLGVDADRGRVGQADVLKNGLLESRQIDADFLLLIRLNAVLLHCGHDGVGHARLDVQVHHHFGEVDSIRRIGRGAAVDGKFDVSGRDRIE